jgi:hypothetical protein
MPTSGSSDSLFLTLARKKCRSDLKNVHMLKADGRYSAEIMFREVSLEFGAKQVLATPCVKTCAKPPGLVRGFVYEKLSLAGISNE